MDRETRDFARRGQRRPATLSAAVDWADGTSGRALVTNVSYTGCRMIADKALAKGETVRLTLPALGRVFAQVRWVRDDTAGVRFITGDNAKDTRRARIGV